jgi:uncharacterized integral membrane protein
MRLILIFLLLIVIAAGALFGALNGRPVSLDLYFVQIDVPLGVALLTALMGGWLLGGLVRWTGEVPRLRRDLRGATVQLRSLERASSSSPGQSADA